MEEELLNENNGKKYNKFQWFFGVIVIPTFFALIVASIVASFAGVDVWGKAIELGEKLPFISTSAEKSDKQMIEDLEKNISELKSEVELKEATITELETEIDRKDKEIQSLTLEKEQLEFQIDDLLNAENGESKSFKEIVNTFESMSAKKAAPIITSMEDSEATKILSSLKPDTIAGLLENMTPEEAAKYTANLLLISGLDSIE
ncbi:MotE family protein [Niallia sp. Krafla_26]|uniref:MotE family protein n=1 Tax=Niallia sp. Krafla_26 TaxID=3064703 RepID=UPI003D16D3F5